MLITATMARLLYGFALSTAVAVGISGAAQAVEPKDLQGSWYDAKCQVYNFKVTGNEVTMTRKTGRTKRRYAGTFAEKEFVVWHDTQKSDVPYKMTDDKNKVHEFSEIDRERIFEAGYRYRATIILTEGPNGLRLKIKPVLLKVKILPTPVSGSDKKLISGWRTPFAIAKQKIAVKASISAKPKSPAAGKSTVVSYRIENTSDCTPAKVRARIRFSFKRGKVKGKLLRGDPTIVQKGLRTCGSVKDGLECLIPQPVSPRKKPIRGLNPRTLKFDLTSKRQGTITTKLEILPKNEKSTKVLAKKKLEIVIRGGRPKLEIFDLSGDTSAGELREGHIYQLVATFDDRAYVPTRWFSSNGKIRVVIGSKFDRNIKLRLKPGKRVPAGLPLPGAKANPANSKSVWRSPEFQIVFEGSKPIEKVTTRIPVKKFDRVEFSYNSNSPENRVRITKKVVATKGIFQIYGSVAGKSARYEIGKIKLPWVRPNKRFVFDMGVKNAGFGEVRNVVITVKVKASGLRGVQITPLSKCTPPRKNAEGWTYTCTVRKFPARDRAKLPLRILPAAPKPGSSYEKISITVSVKGGPSKYFNLLVKSGNVDLRVIPTGTYRSPLRGKNRVEYFIAVENRGPAVAKDVDVTVALPKLGRGVTRKLLASRQEKGTCSLKPRALVCTIAKIGAKKTRKLQITLSCPILNFAKAAVTVEPGGTNWLDANPKNNSFILPAIKGCGKRADVYWVKKKTRRVEVMNAGRIALEYELTLRNRGPHDAKEVFINVRVPRKASLQRGGLGGSCVIKNRKLICRLSILPKGVQITLNLLVAHRGRPPKTIHGSIGVKGKGITDPNLKNNGIAVPLVKLKKLNKRRK